MDTTKIRITGVSSQSAGVRNLSSPQSDVAHLGRIETRYVSAAAMLLLQVTVWQRLAVTPVRSIVQQSTNWLSCRYHLLLSIALLAVLFYD